MAAFRYHQCCPLARAAETVGERWTLLIVRELLLGAKRFSDLRGALTGVSPSVLAERLARLESRGVVARRDLPPPAPATVYELTPSGRALLPAVLELARWGIRFLGPPRRGDLLDPDWLRLGLRTVARRGPSPALRFNVTATWGDREVSFHVAGGEAGTVVSSEPADADASLHADAFSLMALAGGGLDPRRAMRSGALRAAGNVDAVAEFPALFETTPPERKGS